MVALIHCDLESGALPVPINREIAIADQWRARF